MASTLLHEMGWQSDVIEKQFAHGELSPVKAAYNHAQHLPERQKMMQTWANCLDTDKSRFVKNDISFLEALRHIVASD